MKVSHSIFDVVMIANRLLRPERDFFFSAFRTTKMEFLFRLFRLDKLLTFFTIKNEIRGRNIFFVLRNRLDGARVGIHFKYRVAFENLPFLFQVNHHEDRDDAANGGAEVARAVRRAPKKFDVLRSCGGNRREKREPR